MKKDFIITFTTEFFALLSGILVYKLAAILLGKDGFSEYALSRRTVSLILPALLIGMGVGIPRYIAYSSVSSKNSSSDLYFSAGFLILITIAFVFMFITNMFKGAFAFIFFGKSEYSNLIFPISIMLFGLILHTACYGYFRGRLMMIKANFLQFINMCIIPLIAFIIGKNTEKVLLTCGIFWLLVSFIFFLGIKDSLSYKSCEIYSHGKELLFYGLQRVPGDFAMAGLLSLPSIFTAHISGVKEAGYVAFGTTILNMSGAAFAPIGLILLPKASQLVANKDVKHLKYYVGKVLKITFYLTILGVIFFEIFAKEIITLYLGKVSEDLVFVARIIIIGSLAYTIYVSMRSILDAYYVKSINTRNIIISFLTFLIFSGTLLLFKLNYIYLIFSFVLALFLLGGLTLLEIRKVLEYK